MEMQYEVRYLVNGEENTMFVEATSAAAASEMVRHKVSGPDDDFELIQVSLVDLTADETPTS
jgi:hypothetical protein